MTITATPPDASTTVEAAPPAPPAYDWDAIAASADFRALVKARRRFVTVQMGLWSTLFGAFCALVLLADSFMSTAVYGDVKVGFVVAMLVCLISAVTPRAVATYNRRAIDPLVARVRELAGAETIGADR